MDTLLYFYFYINIRWTPYLKYSTSTTSTSTTTIIIILVLVCFLGLWCHGTPDDASTIYDPPLDIHQHYHYITTFVSSAAGLPALDYKYGSYYYDHDQDTLTSIKKSCLNIFRTSLPGNGCLPLITSFRSCKVPLLNLK